MPFDPVIAYITSQINVLANERARILKERASLVEQRDALVAEAAEKKARLDEIAEQVVELQLAHGLLTSNTGTTWYNENA